LAGLLGRAGRDGNGLHRRRVYFADAGFSTPVLQTAKGFSGRLRIALSVHVTTTGTETVLEAITIHLLAGAVAGSVFRIGTLSLIMAFVVAETAWLGLVEGTAALSWAAAALAATQVGFIAGILIRSALEYAGYAPSPVDNRRTR
jgi:hypothetical protein